MTMEWEQLAFGNRELPPLRRLGVMTTWRASLAYLQAAWIYRRHGFPSVKTHLLRLQSRFDPLDVRTPEEAARIARRQLPWLRLPGRFIGESYVCLPNSVSLTAGLIALGLQAQVVVAKPMYFLSPEFEFHAWVEVQGIAINDNPLTQRSCIVLLRCPVWSQEPAI